VLFDKGTVVVHPLENDEFTIVGGKFLRIILRVFEIKVGCGFPWFDLGEGRQAESEEGGAGKEEAFDHELTFSLRIQKSRWVGGEKRISHAKVAKDGKVYRGLRDKGIKGGWVVSKATS
jgi:hypothetical protein